MVKETDVQTPEVTTPPVDTNAEVEALKAQLAAAQAEVEKAKADVVAAKAEIEATPVVKMGTAEQETYLEEKVPVMLMKDNNKYRDDVTVIYNGKNYQIKRGITVMVPRKIKNVLDDSFAQQMVAADLSTKLEAEFEAKASRLS